jgi:hypothetical protein
MPWLLAHIAALLVVSLSLSRAVQFTSHCCCWSAAAVSCASSLSACMAANRLRVLCQSLVPLSPRVAVVPVHKHKDNKQSHIWVWCGETSGRSGCMSLTDGQLLHIWGAFSASRHARVHVLLHSLCLEEQWQ